MPPLREARDYFKYSRINRHGAFLVLFFACWAIMAFHPASISSVMGGAISDPPSRARVPLKGKGKELCLDCHPSLEDSLSKKYLHTPFKRNECFGCHNPHTSDHKGLVIRKGTLLCYGCHEEEKRRFSQGSIHEPILKIGCRACHHPHATDFQNELLNETSVLCLNCHKEVRARLQYAFVHYPFKGQNCLKCHSPHSSRYQFLLRKDPLATCLSCHESGTPSFIQAHNGMDVGKSDCSGCHSAHGSEREGLLHKYQNGPFKERKCSLCHTMSSPEPEELVMEATALCLMCHEDVAGKREAFVSHRMDVKKGCLSCHAPHASPSVHLFRRKEKVTCLTCHEDIKNRFSRYRYSHPEKVEGGRCSICHSIHSGKEQPLLSLDSIQICHQCHGEHFRFSHPMGRGVKDVWHKGEEVTCLSCHDPHGSNFRAFLRRDPSRDLCIQCHKVS